MFTVLPFGLCSAPFIFTKVMRCPVKFWRLRGIKISTFIDAGSSPTHVLAAKEGQAKKYFTTMWVL